MSKLGGVTIAVLAACVSAFLGLHAQSAEPARVTGLFSNMAYNTDAGDLLGMEVFIVAGPGGWFATVQCAGGEPGKPVVVPVQATDLRVSFTLPEGEPECGTEFTGTVSAAGLRGKFVGETSSRWLPRTRSYWQP